MEWKGEERMGREREESYGRAEKRGQLITRLCAFAFTSVERRSHRKRPSVANRSTRTCQVRRQSVPIGWLNCTSFRGDDGRKLSDSGEFGAGRSFTAWTHSQARAISRQLQARIV